MNREQLLATLWLRWRLTRNQFYRGGNINAVLSFILVGLMAVGFVLAGAAGVAIGYTLLGTAAPDHLLFGWDVAVFLFLIFWFAGLMMEIQRSESVELGKLMHLPVTLRQVFLVNYVSSHLSVTFLIFGPLLLCMWAGLVVRSGWRMAPLLLPLLGFLFFVSSWTYWLRGWLASLMVNKRRRRAIIVWITVGFVAIAQLPNLLMQNGLFGHRPGTARKGRTHAPPAPVGHEQVVEAHLVIPPGWPGYSARALAKGSAVPALGTAAVGFALGLFGLRRAYRSTLRFYLGSDSKEPKKRAVVAATKGAKPVSSAKDHPLLVERNLPWLPEEVTALSLATFRSLVRAPEMKMAFIMPLVLGVMLLSAHFSPGTRLPSELVLNFASAFAAMVANFSFANIMSNAFGLDRDGFRALVLLPTPRARILAAKNLALLPFVAGTGALMLLAVKLVLRLGWAPFLAGIVQVVTAYLLFSLFCNVLSTMFPYKFAAGSLQTKKPKAVVFLGMLVSLFIFPLIIVPAAIPPAVDYLFKSMQWLPSWVPLNLALSVVVLGATVWVYVRLLPLEGRLLQRREKDILKEVTEDIE